MRLEFDIGNTNHKWRLLDAESVIARGQFANHDGNGLSNLKGQLPATIDACWISCVASTIYVANLAKWVKTHFNIRVEQAVVSQCSEGVTCIYDEPHRLGVDRWLVLLAAYHQYGASCVIDAGSALTVDVVSGQGMQLGGYIVPGYDLLLGSLFKDTEKVRWLATEAIPGLGLGKNTAQAVTQGARLMLQGFVKQALMYLPENESFQIIFTGGGANSLAELVASQPIVCPDLVFDGLYYCQREVVECE